MGRLSHFVRAYCFSLIWEELMPIQIFIVYFDNNLQDLLLPSIVNHVEWKLCHFRVC